MKTTFLLCLLLLGAVWTQAQNEKSFQYLDVGGGISLQLDKHAVFNLDFTSEISKNLALVLGYNIGVDKSSVEFHELSVKLGPYFKLGEKAYFMLSAGGAVMFNPSGASWSYQTSDSYMPYLTSDESNNLISVPLQAKLNIAIYKRLGFGAKYTYNKNFKDGVDNLSTFMLFFSFQL